MKLVSFDNGTLIALFSLEAYVPLRFTGQRALMELIGEMYGFAKRPALSASVDEIQQTGFEFANGQIEIGGEMVPIHRFAIHHDGVVIDAPTTDDADHIFEHIQTWMKSQGAFRETDVSRLYMSRIVVDFEKSPQLLIKHFDRILSLVTKEMETSVRPATEEGLSSISFEFRSPPNNVAKFAIERRNGASMSEERYYCTAPLRTKHHIEALEAIEGLYL